MENRWHLPAGSRFNMPTLENDFDTGGLAGRRRGWYQNAGHKRFFHMTEQHPSHMLSRPLNVLPSEFHRAGIQGLNASFCSSTKWNILAVTHKNNFIDPKGRFIVFTRVLERLKFLKKLSLNEAAVKISCRLSPEVVVNAEALWFHIFLIQHHFKVTLNTWKHGVSRLYEWHSGSLSLMLYSSSFSFHFYVEKLFWSEIDLSFSSSSAASQTASIHRCYQPSAHSGRRCPLKSWYQSCLV